jgi:hypothetical protein
MWYPNKAQWRVIWAMALGWTAFAAAEQALGAFLLGLLIDGLLLV